MSYRVRIGGIVVEADATTEVVNLLREIGAVPPAGHTAERLVSAAARTSAPRLRGVALDVYSVLRRTDALTTAQLAERLDTDIRRIGPTVGALKRANQPGREVFVIETTDGGDTILSLTPYARQFSAEDFGLDRKPTQGGEGGPS